MDTPVKEIAGRILLRLEANYKETTWLIREQ